MRKTKLDLDALGVDSFETGAAADVRGTVEGRDSDQQTTTPPQHECTCFDTCICKSAYYYCGTGHDTIYSCDWTVNSSCWTTPTA
jgi:hypothetical protein